MTAPVRTAPPAADAPHASAAAASIPEPVPSLAAVARADGAGRIPVRAVAVVALLALVVAVLAVIDVTQGTAAVGPREVWQALTGRATPGDASVVVASRLPRMAAGILVGLALGAAGAALQTVSRNVLASPDTLAVNAGAYAALAVAAVTGLTLPVLAGAGVAFVGGLVAAAIVLAVSGLGSGTVRLVLAGSALALGLGSVTSALLLLFPQQTSGLYRWGQGGIGQNGFDAVAQMAPVVVVALGSCCSSPAGSTRSGSATTPPAASASTCGRPA
ncbi:Fe(3+) dicitrate transport system permease protein FecD [Clavibacter michiganensis subsp. michiganensis]|nr:iron chelate uptake ABC transporter family permease subunit [Clavibacter michiganensis]OUD98346.1 Fe(3+) dicitrate transport system permease protein FecD [Clavibacter michiganensis subsp. michiganensis]